MYDVVVWIVSQEWLGKIKVQRKQRTNDKLKNWFPFRESFLFAQHQHDVFLLERNPKDAIVEISWFYTE